MWLGYPFQYSYRRILVVESDSLRDAAIILAKRLSIRGPHVLCDGLDVILVLGCFAQRRRRFLLVDILPLRYLNLLGPRQHLASVDLSLTALTLTRFVHSLFTMMEEAFEDFELQPEILLLLKSFNHLLLLSTNWAFRVKIPLTSDDLIIRRVDTQILPIYISD